MNKLKGTHRFCGVFLLAPPNGNLNPYFAARNVKLHVVVVVAKLYRQLEMASIEPVEDAK
jgi:hypothetical protein